MLKSSFKLFLFFSIILSQKNFSIIVLPDVQFYNSNLSGGSVEIFSNQIKWIVEKKDSLNIVFVAQVGDLVQNANEKEEEWINADKVMSLLEDSVSTNIKDGIPYGIAVGNHDNGWKPGNTKLYNKYFGESRFSSRSYYGGHYGDKNDNHYAFFSASGMDFMVVFIEISNNQKVNNDVLAWVNELLKTYHNRQVIIVSHFMIYKSGSWNGQGKEIFNTLKNNPNLFLMLCGHVKGEGMRKDFVNPNQVYTLLSNYQHYTNGGNGFLRIVEFSPKNDEINVKTYSPTLNQFEADSNSQFTLDYYMNDAPVLSAISNVTTNEDTAKTVTLSATDVDGDALTYTGKSDTDKVTISISSSIMTLTPAADWYGTSTITAYVSDGTVKDSTSFTLTVASISDVAAINTTTIAEDASATVTLSSTFSGTPTYSAKSDTSAITVSVSSTTLQLTPSSNWNGTSTITVYASVGTFKDSTTFTLSVTAVNDAPVITAVANDSTHEETEKAIKLSASDMDADALTYSAVSDTTGLTVSVLNDSISLKPVPDYFGTSIVKAFVSDGQLTDSTTFTFKVLNIQDAPTAFEWVSSALDTINITQSNLADTYTLQWDASTDVDGDSITYLLYAGTGASPKEEVYDTTSTSLPIPYQEFLQKTFEQIPMLSRATVKFSISATDGIDTVKVTGDDRVVFVNRYDYLSTEGEGIPTEFALHENYPNPFNPTTTLRFDLPEVSNITLTIYNMLGQKVKTFNMQSSPPGYHSIEWNATNENGDPLGAGVYLYRLQAKDFVKTRKMIYLK